MLTLRGKGGYGGSPDVEAGNMYQQLNQNGTRCRTGIIAVRVRNFYFYSMEFIITALAFGFRRVLAFWVTVGNLYTYITMIRYVFI
jgi:hypothetical protein